MYTCADNVGSILCSVEVQALLCQVLKLVGVSNFSCPFVNTVSALTPSLDLIIGEKEGSNSYPIMPTKANR